MMNKMNIYIKLILIAIVFIIGFLSGKKIDSLYYEKILAVTYLSHSNTLKMIEDANQLIINERQSQINHLQEEFAIADKNYLEKMQNVQKENDRLNDCFKSGKCVQRAKIKAPVCADAGGKSDNQQGANEAIYAELDGEVAAGTRRVTDEGDRIISECNQLKDKVEACVESGLCHFRFI